MFLSEFFGNNIKISGNDNTSELESDVFWFILDHDRLHKDYFIPIARKIQSLDSVDKSEVCKLLAPLVNKGCKEYYHQKKLQGHIGKLFPKKMREDLCEKLFNHYIDNKKKFKIK